ncbi:hypothetical protein PXD04_09355 [Methanosphaera sp. ISO3-F5]|uniref:hypothetical protein n=1 Tax=Methanosphaera sp. ISO3-F5 TaxID=1452353 RepID=UPI002B25CA5F|nr:hypothetical protein [Methanosphaera sp. ISO3-F5]WQH63895.1 hypothetical protein PXD04_09355 [Methanosphaera sp. ISO3-F5]
MDSRKFKKINKDNSPKLKHKKKKTKINYINIIKIILIVLVIFIAGSTVLTWIYDANVPGNAEVVYPTQFNFTPYGYDFNNQLYGNCMVKDSNNTTSYYYFTLEQVAALAYHSKNTFNYTSGIYINYTYDEKSNVKVVDKMVDKDKKIIRLPNNYDLESFKQNSRFIGRESQYCTDDFGFSPKEYADSTFQK